MSVRVMTLVWALDLPDSEKIVLLALADCANDEGFCWPSMSTLVKKCSKSERTVQGCIQALKERGHLSRNEEQGKGCSYIVHPRKDCAPAEAAPTPARTAPHPRNRCGVTIKNRKEPLPQKRAIPANWWPEDFAVGTQSRQVVDLWPPGELEAQVEQFRAHHTAAGNKFTSPQQAWATWVLNSRKFGVGRNAHIANIGKSQAAYAMLDPGDEPF